MQTNLDCGSAEVRKCGSAEVRTAKCRTVDLQKIGRDESHKSSLRLDGLGIRFYRISDVGYRISISDLNIQPSAVSGCRYRT